MLIGPIRISRSKYNNHRKVASTGGVSVIDTPGLPATLRPPLLAQPSLAERAKQPNDPLTHYILLCLVAFSVLSFAGELPLNPKPTAPTVAPGSVFKSVRTTAYTHTEGDHLEYGARTAVGTKLLHGQVRSAAADWSVYPVGTIFQISGDSSLYIVDDYGSALVGTGTIDLYKPTTSAMNQWGTRRVTITILKWGSYAKSLAILKPRAYKASHVREMVTRLNARAAA
jgi:3D (Asp-Asp-Asp) domain-containing protein